MFDDDDDEPRCKSCGCLLYSETHDEECPDQPIDERDEGYERAAHRAEMNDFEDTDGKDWR